MRWLGLFAFVAAALVVAGCGGGGGAAGPMITSGPYAPTFQTPCQVLQGRMVVDIRETEFVCDEATVPAETQVIWTNSDEVEHSVVKTSGPGADFNSGPLQPGSTFSQVLDETGEYKIEDEESEGEAATMTIVVEEKKETEPAPGGQPGGTP